MKPIRFDRHAKKRMKERNVFEAEVLLAMNRPDFTEESIKSRKNIYKYMNGRFLRITYKEDSEEILIITVVVRKKSFKG